MLLPLPLPPLLIAKRADKVNDISILFLSFCIKMTLYRNNSFVGSAFTIALQRFGLGMPIVFVFYRLCMGVLCVCVVFAIVLNFLCEDTMHLFDSPRAIFIQRKQTGSHYVYNSLWIFFIMSHTYTHTHSIHHASNEHNCLCSLHILHS